MNSRTIIIGILAVIIIIFGIRMLPKDDIKSTATTTPSVVVSTTTTPIVSPVEVIPVTHASLILKWAGSTLYADPTGTSSLFDANKNPSLILITDIHGDHLSTTTLAKVIGTATVIVPQAVMDLLPQNLKAFAVVMKNGEMRSFKGFTITAVPMYNIPESADSRHTKGRGNGYVIEQNGTSVYIAGDTSNTPEMRALTDIDIAFIPMNLPFTMSVAEAASATLAFMPRQVYPYHYRGQTGLSDIAGFKNLVDKGNKSIEVILKNWYPVQ